MESGSTSTYDTENGVGYEIYLCTNVSGVALLLRDYNNLTGCAAIFKIGLPSHTRPFNCQCFGGETVCSDVSTIYWHLSTIAQHIYTGLYIG